MTDEADAGHGVKKESKVAILVGWAVPVAATAAIGYLSDLDLSTLPGWAANAGILAVSSLIAWLSAYKTRNA